MKAIVIGSLVVLAALAAAACSHAPPAQATDPSTTLGEDGTDAVAVESASSALTAAFTLGTSAGAADGGITLLTPEELVANADKTASNFTNGCMTVTKDTTGHSATYALNGCTGIWGLVGVSGTLEASYSTSTVTLDGGTGPTDAIAIDVVNQGNLLLRNATATTYDAKATFWATSLVNRGMQWSGNLAGTTARGRPFQRTASWEMTWTVAGSCITLNGATNGTVESRSISTLVTNYQRCRGECPAAGGMVQLTDVTGGTPVETIAINFDGGNVATFTDATGKSYNFTLACGL